MTGMDPGSSLRSVRDDTKRFSKLMLSSGPPRFLKFGLVGLVGFLVDAGLLQGLLGAGLGPFSARLISISIAVAVTFLLNRGWAFGTGGRDWRTELAAYIGVAAASALLNYAIFAAILFLRPATPAFLALIVASGTAMAASYLGYGGFVFRKKP